MHIKHFVVLKRENILLWINKRGFHPLTPFPLFFGLQRKAEEKKQAARLCSWTFAPFPNLLSVILWSSRELRSIPRSLASYKMQGVVGPGHLWHRSPWLRNVACLLRLTEKTNGQPWRLRSNHPRHNKPRLLSARLCQGGSGVLGGRNEKIIISTYWYLLVRKTCPPPPQKEKRHMGCRAVHEKNKGWAGAPR